MPRPTTAVVSPKPRHAVEGIEEYLLDNGLRVLLFADPGESTITVNLTVLVGARHESGGQSGLAHFLEHLLFNGTENFPEPTKVLRERGARFNGATWTDRTNYYETLPASLDNLDFALALEADRLRRAAFTAADVTSERAVVLNEWQRAQNQPHRVLLERLAAVAFDWHNYGKTTLGAMDDLAALSLDDIRAFYDRHYQPDNALLVIAGAFDAGAALDLVQARFGGFARPARVLGRVSSDEPPHDGERRVDCRRASEMGMVAAGYHVPAAAHPDFAAARALSWLLTMEPEGRLYRALIATDRAANQWGHCHGMWAPSLLVLGADHHAHQPADDVAHGLLECCERFNDAPLEQEELDRARRRMLKSWNAEFHDSTHLAVALSNWAAQGDWRLFFLYRDRVEQLTPDDARRVAGRYLTRENRTLATLVPTSVHAAAAIPAAPDPRTLLADYRGRGPASLGEAIEPNPLAIEARALRGRLSSGLPYALLPKRRRGEKVSLSLTLRFGDAENLRGRAAACLPLPAWMCRGAGERDHAELMSALDAAETFLRAAGGVGRATLEAHFRRPNLSDALRLLRDVLRAPRFATDEFELERKERLAALRQALDQPGRLADVQARRMLAPRAPGDPRYVPTLVEQIEALERLVPDDARRLHAEFLNGACGELAVVGDFEPADILPRLEEMFADWPGAARCERLPRPARADLPASYVELPTPGKPNAAYDAGFEMELGDAHPDYPALLLANFLLGGGALASRLGQRVRQREGLSYSIASSLHADAFDARARWSVEAACAPGNMPRLRQCVGEELDRFLADGAAPDELTAGVAGLLRRTRVALSNDDSLVSLLSHSVYAQRTLQHDAWLNERIAALTPETLLAAARRRFAPDRLLEAAAGDFAR